MLSVAAAVKVFELDSLRTAFRLAGHKEEELASWRNTIGLFLRSGGSGAAAPLLVEVGVRPPERALRRQTGQQRRDRDPGLCDCHQQRLSRRGGRGSALTAMRGLSLGTSV
ncbi:unnamed protein product [Linum trigynum]|uniref:Uncharacterized protein n=1 Tax=Linum trigynum TaxID=586398 RepID=A0AAV2CIV7_9ROSI